MDRLGCLCAVLEYLVSIVSHSDLNRGCEVFEILLGYKCQCIWVSLDLGLVRGVDRKGSNESRDSASLLVREVFDVLHMYHVEISGANSRARGN